ncbi:sugar transferase, partial [Fulvivirga sp. RKSG066]|uniref:sugar transferase n=1 Tax=Fulvivirga aurantia TaxID=2529383 RepID=UPI0012BB6238
MYGKFTKPFIDKIVAALAIIILSPVFLLVMVLLFTFQKGSVFYMQPRPGYKEKIFTLIKFKTMTDERDAQGRLLPDRDRLTWVGSFVRKTSLDELPQLINILRGEMSFIGPRPWLTEYLDLYTDDQRQRHLVKPGISGWAQVHGRNMVSWEQRFSYDLFYVQNQSFWLDLKIII